MHVLIAPDSFGDALTAPAAAAAIARGWRRARPGDTLRCAPQSDGGPGFVDVLAAAPGGGEVRESEVTGPLGAPVRARWLRRENTAWIESAQACGLHQLGRPPGPGTAVDAGSRGLGELIAAAVGAGAATVVVGLGGSACTDGGAGAAAALGGPAAMRDALRGVALVAAADVRSPLLGPHGAAAVFGPQKGADAAAVRILEARLRRWSAELAAATGVDAAPLPGAGAAGGIGCLLLALGARMVPGARIVGEATGRRAAIAGSGLVVTGEGRLDAQTARGKVVAAVGAEAAECGVPVIAVAGQVGLDEGGLRRLGVAAAWSAAAEAGSARASLERPARWLEEASRRAAASRAAAGGGAR